MRVLVIEDNLDFISLIQEILELKGYEVVSCTNVSSAMQSIENRRPDVIFCDLGLPGELDGFEFAKILRNNALYDTIPLIAISGESIEVNKIKALQAGFDHFLPKPLKFAILSRLLESKLKSKSQNQGSQRPM